jgi:AraC-like DNA-binding protein
MPAFAHAQVLPALAPFVASIGYCEGHLPHAWELAMPTGTLQLLVNLDRDELHSHPAAGDGHNGVQRTGGAALQGPFSIATMIDTAEQRQIMWIAFRFGGSYPFFAVDTAASHDLMIGLEDLWGRDGVTLRDRLLEAPTAAGKLQLLQNALLARAVRPLDRDPAVVAAATALHRGRTVAAVADSLGWTAKRLTRRFSQQIGLTPKRFARVRRFQRVLRRSASDVTSVDWARISAECGFHDQAHLIHEFRAHAGTTPLEYSPRSPAELNHVPV